MLEQEGALKVEIVVEYLPGVEDRGLGGRLIIKFVHICMGYDGGSRGNSDTGGFAGGNHLELFIPLHKMALEWGGVIDHWAPWYTPHMDAPTRSSVSHAGANFRGNVQGEYVAVTAAHRYGRISAEGARNVECWGCGALRVMDHIRWAILRTGPSCGVVDEATMALVRQANLDAFWSRAKGALY
eukprot:scaffold34407_cov34-Attheya_sp.AAC.3